MENINRNNYKKRKQDDEYKTMNKYFPKNNSFIEIDDMEAKRGDKLIVINEYINSIYRKVFIPGTIDEIIIYLEREYKIKLIKKLNDDGTGKLIIENSQRNCHFLNIQHGKESNYFIVNKDYILLACRNHGCASKFDIIVDRTGVFNKQTNLELFSRKSPKSKIFCEKAIMNYINTYFKRMENDEFIELKYNHNSQSYHFINYDKFKEKTENDDLTKILRQIKQKDILSEFFSFFDYYDSSIYKKIYKSWRFQPYPVFDKMGDDFDRNNVCNIFNGFRTVFDPKYTFKEKDIYNSLLAIKGKSIEDNDLDNMRFINWLGHILQKPHQRHINVIVFKNMNIIQKENMKKCLIKRLYYPFGSYPEKITSELNKVVDYKDLYLDGQKFDRFNSNKLLTIIDDSKFDLTSEQMNCKNSTISFTNIFTSGFIEVKIFGKITRLENFTRYIFMINDNSPIKLNLDSLESIVFDYDLKTIDSENTKQEIPKLVKTPSNDFFHYLAKKDLDITHKYTNQTKHIDSDKLEKEIKSTKEKQKKNTIISETVLNNIETTKVKEPVKIQNKKPKLDSTKDRIKEKRISTNQINLKPSSKEEDEDEQDIDEEIDNDFDDPDDPDDSNNDSYNLEDSDDQDDLEDDHDIETAKKPNEDNNDILIIPKKSIIKCFDKKTKKISKQSKKEVKKKVKKREKFIDPDYLVMIKLFIKDFYYKDIPVKIGKRMSYESTKGEIRTTHLYDSFNQWRAENGINGSVICEFTFSYIISEKFKVKKSQPRYKNSISRPRMWSFSKDMKLD